MDNDFLSGQKSDRSSSLEDRLDHPELADLIEQPEIQALMDFFYELARIPMALIDLKGRVLVGVGWQEICTSFHRCHPETSRHCFESDTQLSAGVPPGEFKLYKCKNHMWDVATPIMVGDRHVGNLFSGQFFFEGEEIDLDFFRAQARRYGFPEERYLAAIEAVPRLSRRAMETGMAFFIKLAQLLSQASFNNVQLARSLAEREELLVSLRRSQEDLNRAQAVAGVGSWRLDFHRNDLAWSDEMYRIFGIPPGTPVTYGTALEAIHPDDQKRLKTAWKIALRGEPFDVDFRIRVEDGIRWLRGKFELELDRAGKLLAGFGTIQDITERRRREDELQKAQRLEAIGLLAGGIAHDFNNLLTSILGNISLARMHLPPEEEAARSLALAAQGGIRAAGLSRQLLTFAQGGAPIKRPVQLPALVRESVDLALRGSRVKGEFSFAPDLQMVEADEHQLNQAISNLAINAVQAMPEGGVLQVRAANQELLKGNQLGLGAGRYVQIEMRDQGCGIPEELIAKVFDPYFTTKEGGTGLGLAISYSVVRRHQGWIGVESAPGRGSTFTLCLPASEGVAAEVQEKQIKLNYGTGRILVMDDEEMVRGVAVRALERLGYQATGVTDGAEAVTAYRQAVTAGLPFAAVILDLTVPAGMGGREAARQILAADPGAKIIVSSGYANDPIMAAPETHGFRGVIPKPYELADLSETVRKVVEAD